MENLFSNIYKYRQTGSINQKENFLTEIFAYCLINDRLLRKRFLELLEYTGSHDEFSCQTQYVDAKGRPDIFIKLGNDTVIAIECKVDAIQEETQLTRYSDFLLGQSEKKKILVFLTKHYEGHDTFPEQINFFRLRWFNVYDILQGSAHHISQELSKYLNSEKMSTTISFQKSELQIIKDYVDVYGKMTDFLIRLKDFLAPTFQEKIRIFNSIEKGNYYGAVFCIEDVSIWTGFYQMERNEEMQIAISIDNLSKKSKNYDAVYALLDNLNWSSYEDMEDNSTTWYIERGLSRFFENEVFKVGLALEFLQNEFVQLKKLK